jgi:hypothetical protein
MKPYRKLKDASFLNELTSRGKTIHREPAMAPIGFHGNEFWVWQGCLYPSWFSSGIHGVMTPSQIMNELL